MSKENKLIPELRFPEFKNEGEWNVKIVSEIAKYENGKAHEQDIDEKGKYVVVNSKFISTDGEVRKFSNSANCIAKKNDVLMVLSDVPNGRAIAKCFYVDKDNYYTVNQRICKISPVKVDSKLLLYLLNRKQFFLNFDDGVKQTNLRNEDVLNCPLILPKNPKEQQKIASCLSSLDEVIAGHSQKLDKLKDHKKGLMQNLFPQEGEKVPKYRFEEFEKDGEWVEKTLNKVVIDFIVPMRDKPKKLDGEIPWCRIEDFNGIYLSSSKSNQGVSLETVKEMNLKIYPVNTLLVSCSADLGRCAITKKPLITNQTFIGLVPNENNIDSLFLYYIMTNSRNELNARSSGTTISYLSRQQFEKFEILIPPNDLLKEQKKIASCLSSLDALITAQAEKIEQLKWHKKGLMQGLFPRIND
jgi:type I restriction enzyme S subunit